MRAHPLFRRGYNMGYAYRAREESLAELEQHGPRSARRVQKMAPRRFGVTSGGLRDLSPGVQVARELEAMSEYEFTTETPCCARSIEVLRLEEDQDCPAVCCRCRISYQMGLVQEEPDGFSDEAPYVAIFTVTHLGVAVARHRAGKWERRGG